MGAGESAEREIRKQGLNVIEVGAAESGIAHMTDGELALQSLHGFFAGEVVADESQSFF